MSDSLEPHPLDTSLPTRTLVDSNVSILATSNPSQVGPSQVGPSQVGPSQVGPSQVGPSQVGPSQVGSTPSISSDSLERRRDFNSAFPELPTDQTMGQAAANGTHRAAISRSVDAPVISVRVKHAFSDGTFLNGELQEIVRDGESKPGDASTGPVRSDAVIEDGLTSADQANEDSANEGLTKDGTVNSPSLDSEPEFLTSDQRIEFLVQRLLTRKLNQCARHIVFDVQDGHVLIKGAVTSYYFKQLAQESALRVDGVICVVNQIRVEP